MQVRDGLAWLRVFSWMRKTQRPTSTFGDFVVGAKAESGLVIKNDTIKQA
jgi:hypothetical protein